MRSHQPDQHQQKAKREALKRGDPTLELSEEKCGISEISPKMAGDIQEEEESGGSSPRPPTTMWSGDLCVLGANMYGCTLPIQCTSLLPPVGHLSFQYNLVCQERIPTKQFLNDIMPLGRLQLPLAGVQVNGDLFQPCFVKINEDEEDVTVPCDVWRQLKSHLEQKDRIAIANQYGKTISQCNFFLFIVPATIARTFCGFEIADSQCVGIFYWAGVTAPPSPKRVCQSEKALDMDNLTTADDVIVIDSSDSDHEDISVDDALKELLPSPPPDDLQYTNGSQQNSNNLTAAVNGHLSTVKSPVNRRLCYEKDPGHHVKGVVVTSVWEGCIPGVIGDDDIDMDENSDSPNSSLQSCSTSNLNMLHNTESHLSQTRSALCAEPIKNTAGSPSATTDSIAPIEHAEIQNAQRVNDLQSAVSNSRDSGDEDSNQDAEGTNKAPTDTTEQIQSTDLHPEGAMCITNIASVDTNCVLDGGGVTSNGTNTVTTTSTVHMDIDDVTASDRRDVLSMINREGHNVTNGNTLHDSLPIQKLSSTGSVTQDDNKGQHMDVIPAKDIDESELPESACSAEATETKAGAFSPTAVPAVEMTRIGNDLNSLLVDVNSTADIIELEDMLDALSAGDSNQTGIPTIPSDVKGLDSTSKESDILGSTTEERTAMNSVSKERDAMDSTSKESAAMDSAPMENAAMASTSKESTTIDCTPKEGAAMDFASKENAAVNPGSKESVVMNSASRERAVRDWAPKGSKVTDSPKESEVTNSALRDSALIDSTSADGEDTDCAISDSTVMDCVLEEDKIMESGSKDNKVMESASKENKIIESSLKDSKDRESASRDSSGTDTALEVDIVTDCVSKDSAITDSPSNKVIDSAIDSTLKDSKVTDSTSNDGMAMDSTPNDSMGTVSPSKNGIATAEIKDDKVSMHVPEDERHHGGRSPDIANNNSDSKPIAGIGHDTAISDTSSHRETRDIGSHINQDHIEGDCKSIDGNDSNEVVEMVNSENVVATSSATEPVSGVDDDVICSGDNVGQVVVGSNPTDVDEFDGLDECSIEEIKQWMSEPCSGPMADSTSKVNNVATSDNTNHQGKELHESVEMDPTIQRNIAEAENASETDQNRLCNTSPKLSPVSMKPHEKLTESVPADDTCVVSSNASQPESLNSEVTDSSMIEDFPMGELDHIMCDESILERAQDAIQKLRELNVLELKDDISSNQPNINIEKAGHCTSVKTEDIIENVSREQPVVLNKYVIPANDKSTSDNLDITPGNGLDLSPTEKRLSTVQQCSTQLVEETPKPQTYIDTEPLERDQEALGDGKAHHWAAWVDKNVQMVKDVLDSINKDMPHQQPFSSSNQTEVLSSLAVGATVKANDERLMKEAENKHAESTRILTPSNGVQRQGQDLHETPLDLSTKTAMSFGIPNDQSNEHSYFKTSMKHDAGSVERSIGQVHNRLSPIDHAYVVPVSKKPHGNMAKENVRSNVRSNMSAKAAMTGDVCAVTWLSPLVSSSYKVSSRPAPSNTPTSHPQPISQWLPQPSIINNGPGYDVSCKTIIRPSLFQESSAVGIKPPDMVASQPQSFAQWPPQSSHADNVSRIDRIEQLSRYRPFTPTIQPASFHAPTATGMPTPAKSGHKPQMEEKKSNPTHRPIWTPYSEEVVSVEITPQYTGQKGDVPKQVEHSGIADKGNPTLMLNTQKQHDRMSPQSPLLTGLIPPWNESPTSKSGSQPKWPACFSTSPHSPAFTPLTKAADPEQSQTMKVTEGKSNKSRVWSSAIWRAPLPGDTSTSSSIGSSDNAGVVVIKNEPKDENSAEKKKRKKRRRTKSNEQNEIRKAFNIAPAADGGTKESANNTQDKTDGQLTRQPLLAQSLNADKKVLKTSMEPSVATKSDFEVSNTKVNTQYDSESRSLWPPCFSTNTHSPTFHKNETNSQDTSLADGSGTALATTSVTKPAVTHFQLLSCNPQQNNADKAISDAAKERKTVIEGIKKLKRFVPAKPQVAKVVPKYSRSSSIPHSVPFVPQQFVYAQNPFDAALKAECPIPGYIMPTQQGMFPRSLYPGMLPTPTTMMQIQAPTSMIQIQAPTSMMQIQAPTSMMQNQAPGGGKQIQAPTTMMQIQAPGRGKQIQAPAAMMQIQAPNSIMQIQAPGGGKQIQAPTSMMQIQAPTSMMQIQAPTSMMQIQAPGGGKQIQAPTSMMQIQAPGGGKQIQAPTSMMHIQAPGGKQIQAPTSMMHIQASGGKQIQAPTSMMQIQAPGTGPVQVLVPVTGFIPRQCWPVTAQCTVNVKRE